MKGRRENEAVSAATLCVGHCLQVKQLRNQGKKEKEQADDADDVQWP